MALLTSDDVRARLAINDPSNSVTQALGLITSHAYSVMTDLTEIPFSDSGTTVTGETPYIHDYSQNVLTNFWPVNSITSATYYGNALTVTTLNGQFTSAGSGNTIAPMANLWGVRLGFNPGQNTAGPLLITYTAGYSTMPSDLAEVFIQLCALMWKEKDRIGEDGRDMIQSSLKYTRRLPEWLQWTISKYRRIHHY